MLMTFNPAINGWAIFSEACLCVMAKCLRDVCSGWNLSIFGTSCLFYGHLLPNWPFEAVLLPKSVTDLY